MNQNHIEKTDQKRKNTWFLFFLEESLKLRAVLNTNHEVVFCLKRGFILFF